MINEEVIINENALMDVSSTIKSYSQQIKMFIKNTLACFESLQSDWNDSDYDKLISALNSFDSDVISLENAVSQLVLRIDQKLQAIEQLHKM